MAIELKPHNEETYGKVIEGLKKSNRVAVVHPTGTGKMYIALKLLEEHKKKNAIYLAPSNPILHDVKKSIFAEGMNMTDFPNLKRLTYQKLVKMSDEEIKSLKCDIIIADEFQYCGAPEYQKAVQKLIENNPNAIILGLSATPIRYNDGLRDMSDELFDGHVVSEMTLEEAIEKGILPEATYVSALYGYKDELEKMKKNIMQIENTEKRAQAEKLYKELSEKLDENTENLPELLAEYMKNKNGKYIIFCESIEDMKNKMQQEHQMFDKVNTNITIRGVSSDIKGTDRILTEFENDNDENSLKLMYAVDMLNAGYHLKDLSGVIMMRKTYSPGIFTQQLGRALSVGGEKTVVLDLVNNFERCQIIADFAEKMKQYKGRKGKEGKSDKQEKGHARIAIFDNTKQFREIIDRITALSNTKVYLAEKIEIFERFAETGERLTGNTIFEGYPIGQWAIQIRNAIKRENEGKGKGLINPTEEQLERLGELGILDRQIEATIDEKIEMVIQFREKYPKVSLTRLPEDDVLKKSLMEYCSNPEEYQQLLEEYGKMHRYYEYIKYRNYQGKLTEEQISKCKEGNVGGVFGNTTEVETMLEKYGLNNNDMQNICSKYGTIENFLKAFINGEITDKDDIKLASSCTINAIDIDKNPNSFNYEILLRVVFGDLEFRVFSSKLVDEVLEMLTDRERRVIELRFGLVTGKAETSEEIGQRYDVTRERVRQIEAKALRKLRHPSKHKKLGKDWESLKQNKFLTQEEQDELFRLDEIFSDIRLKNIDIYDVDLGIENFKYFMDLQGKLNGREDEAKQKVLEGMSQKRKTIKEETIPIEDLDFSVRTYNCLKRAGNNTLGDLLKLTNSKLENIRNMGKKSYDEVIEKLSQLGLKLKGENEEKLGEQDNNDGISEIEAMTIEDLDFSVRVFNHLKRAGINTVRDIIGYRESELRRVSSLENSRCQEIIEKLSLFGLKLKEENVEELCVPEDTGDTITESAKESGIIEAKEIIQESATVYKDEPIPPKEAQTDETSNQTESEEEIAKNDAETKKALIQRILGQQKTIAEQQAQMQELNGSREGVTNE